eukprot:tig00021179_g19272.t1
MDALPNELLTAVFGFLGSADRGRCAAVNSAWRELVYDPALWTDVRFDVFEQNLRSVFLFSSDYLDPTGEEFARLPAGVPTFGRRRAVEVVAQPRFKALRSLELVLWHDAPADFGDQAFCHYFFGNAPATVERLTITEKARVLRGREKEPLAPFLDKFELRYIFSRFPRITHLALSGLVWDHNVFVAPTLVRNGPVGAWHALSPFLPNLRSLDASSELDMASPLLAAIALAGVREIGALRVSSVADMLRYGDPAEISSPREGEESAEAPAPRASPSDTYRGGRRTFVFYAPEAQTDDVPPVPLEQAPGTPPEPAEAPETLTQTILAPRVRKLVFEPTALASDGALGEAAARRLAAMRPEALHGLVYGGAVEPAVWAQVLAGVGRGLRELAVREVQRPAGGACPPIDDPWIRALADRCPGLTRLVVKAGLFFGNDSPVQMTAGGLCAAVHKLRRLQAIEMDWTPGDDCIALLQLLHKTCPHVLYATFSSGSVGSLFTYHFFPKGHRPSASGRMTIPHWEMAAARAAPRVIEVLRNSLRIAVYISEAEGKLVPVAMTGAARPGSGCNHFPTPR